MFFGRGLGVAVSWVTAGQFYAGYLTEYSLSLDNLFFFYLIMSRSRCPPPASPASCCWVSGSLSSCGRSSSWPDQAAINHSGWLFYPLAAVLAWTAISLITGRPDQPAEEQHTRLVSCLRPLRSASFFTSRDAHGNLAFGRL